MGRRRAAVLIIIHVLIAIHVAHWMATGSSVSPLEPSEAMEFSQRGVVNAGLVFFGLTILSTLVLGRWFCGWGCHVVALQDLSRAVLLKLGITPRPLRSRALLLVPLLAFIYMFVLPFVTRLWLDTEVSGGTHLTTTEFWATFPSWPVAAATFLVVGFGSVYFLGAKGFCTYGCPYGAIFGLVDNAAPGRIRVTDACSHCGHCTSVCSSNVLVHAEVRDYGMVVDPGCMKCMDCVSVCPNDALYFGFGRPALLKQRTERYKEARRKPAFTLAEEVLLLVLFTLALLAFRGIYNVIPFLFALGIAGVVAFVAFLGIRIIRRPTVKLLRWHLKRRGRLERPGRLFVGAFLVLLVLWVHSGLIQYRTWRAEALFEATGEIRPSWSAQLERPAELDGSQRDLVDGALAHATFVQRWGLLATPQNDLRLAWLHLLKGEADEAEAALRRALPHVPRNARARFDLANLLAKRGRAEQAIPLYREVIELQPEDAPGARRNLARLLFETGDLEGAAAEYEAAITEQPGIASLRYDLGVLEATRGRAGAAKERFREALRLQPEHTAARDNLVGSLEALLQAKQNDAALEESQALLEILPEDPDAHRVAGLVCLFGERFDQAERHLERSLAGREHVQTLTALALLARRRGDTQRERSLLERAKRLR